MTEEPASSAWERARAHGCDMALLEDCMRRTPTERIKRHQLALESIAMLRTAMEESHAGFRSTAQETD